MNIAKKILLTNTTCRTFKALHLFLWTLLFTGCEKTVSVDLTTEPPRLVVDAAINWQKGTPGNVQTIRLSATAGYWQNNITAVSGADITVSSSTGTKFIFTEISNTGNYVCTNFLPVLNQSYKLNIIVKGEIYTAEEKMMLTPGLTDVEQKNDLGFNSNEIGLRINFKDTVNQRNYYLLRTDFSENPFPEYQILDDQFSDGNTLSWLYTHKKLSKNKTLVFTQFGISESYSNYMRLITGASAGANNGPFQVIPARIRGNIINLTNAENFALGYFRLCEVSGFNYIVK